MSETMKRIIMFIIAPVVTVIVIFTFRYSWTVTYEGPSLDIKSSKIHQLFIRNYDTETTLSAKFTAWSEKRSKTVEWYFLGVIIDEKVIPQTGERICIRFDNSSNGMFYYVVGESLKAVGSINKVSGFDIDNSFDVPHIFKVYEFGRKDSVGTIQIKEAKP